MNEKVIIMKKDEGCEVVIMNRSKSFNSREN